MFFILFTQLGLSFSAWCISVITPYHIHNPSGTLANQSIQMDSLTYQGVQMNDVRVTWQWSFSGPKVQSLNCESIHLNLQSLTPDLGFEWPENINHELKSIALKHLSIQRHDQDSLVASFNIQHKHHTWLISSADPNKMPSIINDESDGLITLHKNHITIASKAYNLNLELFWQANGTFDFSGIINNKTPLKVSPNITINSFFAHKTNQKWIMDIDGDTFDKPFAVSITAHANDKGEWQGNGEALFWEHQVTVHYDNQNQNNIFNGEIHATNEHGINATVSHTMNDSSVMYHININHFLGINTFELNGSYDFKTDHSINSFALNHEDHHITGQCSGPIFNLKWNVHHSDYHADVVATTHSNQHITIHSLQFEYQERTWQLSHPIDVTYQTKTGIEVKQAELKNDINHTISVDKAMLTPEFSWHISCNHINIPFHLLPQEWLSLTNTFKTFKGDVTGSMSISGTKHEIENIDAEMDVVVKQGGIYDLVPNAPIELDIFITEASHIAIRQHQQSFKLLGILNTNIGAITLDGAASQHDHHVESNLHLTSSSSLHSSHKKHDLWFKPNINIELIDDIITTVDVNIEVNKGDYTFYLPHLNNLIDAYDDASQPLPYTHVYLIVHPDVHFKYLGIQGQAEGALDMVFKGNNTIINGHFDLLNPTITLFSRHAKLDDVSIDFQHAHDWSTALLYLNTEQKQINTNGNTEHYNITLSGPINDLNFQYYSDPSNNHLLDIAAQIFNQKGPIDHQADQELIQLLASNGIPASLMSFIETFASLESALFLDTIQIDPNLITQYGEFLEAPSANITLRKRLGQYFNFFYKLTTENLNDNQVGLTLQLSEHSNLSISKHSDSGISLLLGYNGKVT